MDALFDADAWINLARMLAVALGIGLVIFVHELGHFLAARACGVRVEVFSIGFGPALVSWQRGFTLYKLGIVPLGGYVRMSGDEGVPRGERHEPHQLPSKSVGQRFLIYSGGVLANLAFALVVFPVLFAVGVPFIEPVLGEPLPGGAAWHARLEPGTRVLSVNGHTVFDYLHVPNEVALGDPQRVTLEVLEPGAQRHSTVTLTPQYREDYGLYSIDVTPSIQERRLDVEEGSPAWKAGLRPGDRLVGVPDSLPGVDIVDGLVRSIALGEPLAMVVEGQAGRRTTRVVPELSEEPGPARLGIQSPRNAIQDLRGSELTDALDLREGDVLLEVQGLPIQQAGDLPRALAQEGREELRFVLSREGRRLERSVPLPPGEERVALAADVWIGSGRDSTDIVVQPGSPAAEAGLASGDRIVQIDDVSVSGWNDILERVQEAAADGRAVALQVERVSGDRVERFTTVAKPEAKPLPHYGFAVREEPAQYLYRVGHPLGALKVGAAASWKLLQDSWLTLKGMIMQRVRTDNIGGIITIGKISYTWSEAGLAKLLFFLCMISVNLAFLNVLPIPVLDGGHLFFLLIEKVKGSPVSERVLGYSQMVGLVLILSLMVYVTFNDIARWFFPG